MRGSKSEDHPVKGRHRAGKNTACMRSSSTRNSVWACADDEPAAGTGSLAGWLLNAVVKVVTNYSTPGDRVLLLSPSPLVTGRRGGQYCGLSEAVWPVVRLGRGVRTAAMCPYVRTQPDPVTASLIVAAAEPRALAVVRPTSWRPALSPRGVLAVITHADTNGQRLNDPTGMLVRTAREDGLRYVDRIALVRVPMAEVRTGRAEPSIAAVSVRAHADLHLFTVDGDRR